MSNDHDEYNSPGNSHLQSLLASISSIIHDARKYSIITQGFAEILHRGLAGSLNEEQKEISYELIRRAIMLSHILEQGIMLLDIDIYPRRPEPAVHLLNKLIQDTINYATNRNKLKDVIIQFNQDNEDLPIFVDADDVKHLLMQLLDNAIKYTPETGTIIVQTSASEGVVAISIRDTGVGIPPELQASLFQRLSSNYQHLPNELSGSGVGLAIAQALAQRNNGHIRLTHTNSNGTAFIVMLPKDYSSM